MRKNPETPEQRKARLEYNNRKYHENRQSILQERKIWRKTHPKNVTKWNSHYYKLHKEEKLLREAERYRVDRERILKQKAEYYQKNKETIKPKHRLWQKNNYKNAKQLGLVPKGYKSRRRHSHRIRMRLLEFFGGKCIECGNFDFRCLQLDHINGGGKKDYQKHKVGNYMINKYKLIKENPIQARKELQILCANCNWIKRWENKEWRKIGIENKRNRENNQKLRLQIQLFLGGHCCECSCDDFRCLQLDHINGNGRSDIIKNGSNSYSLTNRIKMIKQDPEGFKQKYQLLCANCNWIKRWTKKEFCKYEDKGSVM